jgi:hypothetical protein
MALVGGLSRSNSFTRTVCGWALLSSCGGSMDGFIEITINNWDKYNSRNDVKAPTWFRLKHDLFENHEFYDFTHEELCVWIYILCLASKKSSPTIKIVINHARSVGRFKASSIESAISKLLVLSIVSRARNGHVTDTIATLHNKTLHDITLHNTIAHFEKCAIDIYSIYPKKIGKKKAFAKLKTILKSDEDVSKLEKAIDNYTAYLKINKTEAKFIKNFDTFINQWEDWLDPTTGNTNSFEPKPRTIKELIAERERQRSNEP